MNAQAYQYVTTILFKICRSLVDLWATNIICYTLNGLVIKTRINDIFNYILVRITG